MNIVRATGPRDSPPLAIVGEAPGVEEEKQGAPFVGASGFLLNQMLASAGVARSDCFITNVMDFRPPSNNFDYFYSDGSKRKLPSTQLINGRERLWKEIREVKPAVVVVVGNEALRALTHEWGIMKWRGMIIDKFDIRVLPTYHPAYVLRMYGERPVVEADLKKAYRQALHPHIPEPDLFLDPTLDDVILLLNSRPERIVLDLETYRSSYPITRCVGIAIDENTAMSFPLVVAGQPAWNESEEALILESLSKMMLDTNIKKIFQNAPFDCTILAKEFGIHVDGIELDTMFSHHLLYPELPKSLNFLSSLYTDFPLYWDNARRDDLSLRRYNCHDCLATFSAALEILGEMERRGLTSYYYDIIHPAMFALTRMQNRGIRVDLPLRDRLKLETERELGEIQASIHKETGEEINPSSTKQVSKLLYETWRLPPQRKRTTKAFTTDADALKALCRKVPGKAPILRQIIAYREKRTLLSTFIEVDLPVDGRMRTSYNLAGTVTGRISSSQTITDEGGNLQNIPRGTFRRIYAADPGMKLVKADLSQAEFRCVVWFARIQRIIDKYIADPLFDIHTWNASENIFMIPAAEVTKDQRYIAKCGVHGANYGMKAQKAAKVYDIPFPLASKAIDNYHRSVPEVSQVWWKEVEEKLKATRTLTNPMGRERIFFGRMDEELYRKGYNYLAQSTVADVILKAIVDLDEKGYTCLLQVHDEIVIQVPEAEVAMAIKDVKAAMEVPLHFNGVDAPLIIPTEIAVGDNWYDLVPA